MRKDPLSNKYRPQRWLYELHKEQEYGMGPVKAHCLESVSRTETELVLGVFSWK